MAFFHKRRQAVLLSAVTALRSNSGCAREIMGSRSMSHHARDSASFVSAPITTSLLHVSHTLPHHPRQPAGIRVASQHLTMTTRRQLSSSSNNGENEQSSASETTITLPNKTGDRNGLIRHEIVADDGHPLRIYSRTSRHAGGNADCTADNLITTGDVNNEHQQRSILLLHGRTWSSQPVFDLRTSEDDVKQQSTLQSLAELGFNVYALDFRGFGETVRDYDAETGNGGYTTPRRCVADVKCAIEWITKRHEVVTSTDDDEDNLSTTFTPGFEEDPTVINTKPALFGWSQGALVAQMYAQQYGLSTLSDLILFGSIFDPKVIYPRKPLYDPSGRLVSGLGSDAFKPPAPEVVNTDISSLEDFTLPGTICDEAALTFSAHALAVDTIKAEWDELHEFNICNPALVHIPTMVMVGAQDPYVSWEAQRELFDRLGTEDKAFNILPGCDHAAHILKARKMFVRGVAGFLLRKDGF